MQNETPSYVCRLTNQRFSTPCSVTSCMAHMNNLNRSGMNSIPITGCSHIDFHLAGYSEELNYAVDEQGFVGFRDLNYMSAFFGVNEYKLRDIYTNNIELLKKSVAIIWAVKQSTLTSTYHCQHCGHPKKTETFKCVSSTACEDRKEVVHRVAQPYLPAIEETELAALYNILWRAAIGEKFPLTVALDSNEIDQLMEVY